MKKYKKAQMIAKNLPTGSYAAGCPVFGTGGDSGGNYETGNQPTGCHNCERTR